MGKPRRVLETDSSLRLLGEGHMPTRSHFHIIDTDSARRAEASRELMRHEFATEVYANLDEFWEAMPSYGVILAHDDPSSPPNCRPLETMAMTPRGLPLALYSEHPSPIQIVTALLRGAVDYLEWPFDGSMLRISLGRLVTEAERERMLARKKFVAKALVKRLTRSEREVLALLAEGYSNAEMARRLEISPLAVGMHRALMMRKLNAASAADAVRIALQADLEAKDQSSAH